MPSPSWYLGEGAITASENAMTVTKATESTLLDRFSRDLIRRRLSPSTVRLRLFYLEKLATFLRPLNLIEADLEDIERFLDANQHWSKPTLVSAIASIRTFYNWAVEEDMLVRSPTRKLAYVRVQRRPGRMASEAAIATALDDASMPERAMILLGAENGLRLSEIASLNRECRADGWLRVVGKGGVERETWISPELADALDWIENNSMRWGYYFPGRSGGHAHLTTIWRHISSRLESNPHSLRHRAGTVVYKNTGNDLRATQVFLGHAHPDTTAIYVHVSRDDLTRAGMAARIGDER